MSNKVYLEWSEIHECVNMLCKQIITDYPNIDSVMGLPRGGLIPAVLLSHEIGLPYVQHPGKNTLVVDDICDSGVTLSKAPGAYYAVLHYKPRTSCFIPNIYGEVHMGDEWIIYPWEKLDSTPIQDYLK